MPTKSLFITRPCDAAALDFTPEAYGACPDGIGDNTAALQRAADEIATTTRIGIIFIPEGDYVFDGTVNLWPGIRLIGWGENRPVFRVRDNSPAHQGYDSRYIIHFRDRKPTGDRPLRDAQNTSFYGGMRNIDCDLGAGNPGAVAVRFRIAQLCSLEDMEFRIRDGRAGVEMIGNEIERCTFLGGDYGILTGETVPYWQFYLGDSLFDGQRRACISTYRAGLTMTRTTLKNAPYGIFVPNKETDNHYIEEFERLVMEDCRMENIASGVCMNMMRYPQNWFHGENVICKNVPMFFEPFGWQFNGHIRIKPLCPEMESYCGNIHMGLKLTVDNADKTRRFDYDYHFEPCEYTPAPAEPYVTMPDPETWVSILDFGAAADGVTDDSDAFDRAIASGKPIYLPMGAYRISRTIELGENTALIGLQCARTILRVDDNAPGFNDPRDAHAMLKAPAGGHNHVCGISFDGGRNRGLDSVEWLAAPDSILEDILFWHGGHGAVRKSRDRRYTIWVHDGGAGIFKNIWTPDVWAIDGFHINDTENPGKLYLVSIEHHLDVELVMERVCNWKLYAVQTEENLGSEYACSIQMRDCDNIAFYNLFQYRVQAIDIQYPYAGYVENCKDLQVYGQHVFSIGPTPFTNAWLVDGTTVIDDQEFGTLVVNC